jgi:hypothetical protein
MNLRTFALLAASSVMITALAHGAPTVGNIATGYSVLGTSINWFTTGQIASSSSGTLGPFNNACAIIEGTPETQANVISRIVYVLDAGNGDSETVYLYLFIETDTITSVDGVMTDVETIVPGRRVELPLTSQAATQCYMAANDGSVFVGTRANNQAVEVNKKTLAKSTYEISVGYSDNAFVSQISAAEDGLVLITFGTGYSSGWAEFDNEGTYLAAGTGFNFAVVAGTRNATSF